MAVEDGSPSHKNPPSELSWICSGYAFSVSPQLASAENENDGKSKIREYKSECLQIGLVSVRVLVSGFR